MTGESGGKDDVLYKHTDRGPYRVICEAANGKICTMTIGKLLKDKQQNGIMEIQNINSRKCMIICNSTPVANKIVSLTNDQYKFYIPLSFVSVRGVIGGINPNITEEEIQANATATSTILNVYRFKRKDNDKLVPTWRVCITFRSNMIPEYIDIYYNRLKVEKYVPRTVLCTKCLTYGHIAKHCRGKERCSKCGKEAHSEASNCETFCRHCKNNSHTSNDPNCPELNRQKNINKLKAGNNFTYSEIVNSHKELSTGQFDIFLQMEKFPPLPETPQYTHTRNTSNKDPRKRAAIAEHIQKQRKTTTTDYKRPKHDGTKTTTKNGVAFTNISSDTTNSKNEQPFVVFRNSDNPNDDLEKFFAMLLEKIFDKQTTKDNLIQLVRDKLEKDDYDKMDTNEISDQETL